MSTGREEIRAAVAALQTRNGGRPFAPIDIIREMNRLGTSFADETIRSHVVHHMCVDAPGRATVGWNDLRRVGRGMYMLNGDDATPIRRVAASSSAASPDAMHAWPWEGAVQKVFQDWLEGYGWTVTGTADTATRERGVDLLAHRRGRQLGGEVKGWPSTKYADPRRADEVKRTQPTNQASHWFSQALMKAMMLLETHPDHESLIVLPDYPRYRDLAHRTSRGRSAADIHVVFVTSEGQAESDTWTP
ncbi:MAG TPA: hypothetical protein VHC43_03805 [Mycobacteriales bacterium]|nr:hypothetical protein [Mycobacteriales bacterium]